MGGEARGSEAALALVAGDRVTLVGDRPLAVGSDARCDLKVPGVAPRAAWVEQAGPRHVMVMRTHGAETERLERVGLDGVCVIGGEPVLLARRAACDTLVGGATSVVWQGFVTRDPIMLTALGEIARVASATAPVWIQGESGTGKELAARAVHQIGPRARSPFVALNCAALPETLAESELFGVVKGAFTGADRTRPGAFQRAAGGTLFLDEIGELSLGLQAKLLRVLETREVHPIGGDRAVPVDVRVVAATWRDPRIDVAAGRFRHDLMHRLCVLPIVLPPLRERPADVVPLIMEGLAAKGALELAPDGGLRRLLERQSWPGNVRELRNGIERAVAYRSPASLLPDGGEHGGAKLPRRSVRATQPGFGVAAPVVDGLVARTLRHERGNRVRAARALGVSRSTLYRWMRDLGQVGPGRVDTSPAPFMMTEARKA